MVVLQIAQSAPVANKPSGRDAKAILASSRSNEIFLAVVGPVGSGSSKIAAILAQAAGSAGYEPVAIKLSECIRAAAVAQSIPVPEISSAKSPKTLASVVEMQNLGDKLREKDSAVLARLALSRIAEERAARMGISYTEGQAVEPDEKRRAFIIDSLRHPAEVQVLRRAYANSFALVGVVCEDGVRRQRLLEKHFLKDRWTDFEAQEEVGRFMARDADDGGVAFGQHVTDVFHQSDFFIDNTAEADTPRQEKIIDDTGRLIDIITHAKIVRPTIAETAMHHAHSARVRSACLSRQVGAALVQADGTVVATGTNEAPRAGGGVYGEAHAGDPDHRCAFHADGSFCRSTRQQNAIVEELIAAVPELAKIQDKYSLAKSIKKTRLGQLVEFSRAVHAEMDALVSAARSGVSTTGTRLFVTTFPCHYCARHIVSAGVYEVQYIEPYPKSLALRLHSDAIETVPTTWQPPFPQEISGFSSEGVPVHEGKVLFHPFVGVAPRLYIRAFEQTRQLKDKLTGDIKISDPEWGNEFASFKVGYPELEAKLSIGT